MPTDPSSITIRRDAFPEGAEGDSMYFEISNAFARLNKLLTDANVTNVNGDVTSLSSTVDGNTSDIATNTSDIATNTSAIAAIHSAPIGTIYMYGGSSAPTNFYLCDGTAKNRTTDAALFAIIGTTFGVGDGSTTFNLPDFRGIFPRGAGTNGTLTDAGGTAFTTTLGTYSNDSFQNHHHDLTGYVKNNVAGGGAYFTPYYSGGTNVEVTDPTTAGAAYGTPRTGAETAPANLGINFIIKYQ